jgi:hypothetical protein
MGEVGPRLAFSVTSAAWPPFRSRVTGSVSSLSEPGGPYEPRCSLKNAIVRPQASSAACLS